MAETQLVLRSEWWWHTGAGLALVVIALGRRLLWPVIESLWRNPGWPPKLVHWHWFADSQLVTCCLVLAALLLSGCLVPRTYWRLSAWIIGGVGWLTALALLPKAAGGEVLGKALWSTDQIWPPLIWTSAALLAGSCVLHVALRRRWLNTMTGHGYNWILSWARLRPLAARSLATRVLRSLGYHG